MDAAQAIAELQGEKEQALGEKDEALAKLQGEKDELMLRVVMAEAKEAVRRAHARPGRKRSITLNQYVSSGPTQKQPTAPNFSARAARSCAATPCSPSMACAVQSLAT